MSENRLKRICVFIGYYGIDGTNSTIDANKHPKEQIELLLNVLEDTIEKGLECLNIYTNSIYVLNKLMILQLYNSHNIQCEYFKYRLDMLIDVFEVFKNGDIKELTKYKCIVTDDNLLNNMIDQSNQEHCEILKLCQNKKS